MLLLAWKRLVLNCSCRLQYIIVLVNTCKSLHNFLFPPVRLCHVLLWAILHLPCKEQCRNIQPGCEHPYWWGADTSWKYKLVYIISMNNGSYFQKFFFGPCQPKTVVQPGFLCPPSVQHSEGTMQWCLLWCRKSTAPPIAKSRMHLAMRSIRCHHCDTCSHAL